MKTCVLRLTIVVLAAATAALVATPAVMADQSVLVLNSYHDGYVWSDAQVNGIVSALDRPGIRVRVEYMDTKYLDAVGFDDTLRDFYAAKYGNDQPDVIVATDISAKFFLARHHDDLFPGVPTVLAGAHDFRSTAPEGDWWTGVYPVLPVPETLDLVLALQPETSHVLVVAEQTGIGRAMATEITDEAALFHSEPEISVVVDNDIEQLIAAARRLPDTGVILYALVSQDTVGSFVPPGENLARLTSEVDVPVYSILGIYEGMGIVGGVLLEGESIGKAAGNLALRLLGGESHANIELQPVVATRVLCDWLQLERFGIPESRVPDDAVVINAPTRTVEVPRFIVIAAVTGILFLTIAVLVFVHMAHRQRQTQRLLESHKRQIERSLQAESSLAELAGYLNQLENEGHYSNEEITALLRRVVNLETLSVSLSYHPDPSVDDLESAIARHYGTAGNVSGAVSGLPEPLEHRAQQEGAQAFVLSALSAENRTFGWVFYSRTDSDSWTVEETELLSTVTGMLAATWDRFETATARFDAERRNQAARALLEKSGRLASIGVMAAGITHEIAQPLNYIKMTTDGLMRGRAPDATAAEDAPDVTVPARKLSRMSEAVDRIARVVTHMREYWTRSADGAEAITDASLALGSAAELLRRQLVDHGVELVMKLPTGPVPVRSSKVSIEQIFVNLVNNAIHELDAAETKRIDVVLEQVNSGAELRVEDTGPGISEGDLARIFDPFYSSRGPDEGMGLGLAIVRSLVERNGGTIQAYRNDHGGAGFLIGLAGGETEVIA